MNKTFKTLLAVNTFEKILTLFSFHFQKYKLTRNNLRFLTYNLSIGFIKAHNHELKTFPLVFHNILLRKEANVLYCVFGISTNANAHSRNMFKNSAEITYKAVLVNRTKFVPLQRAYPGDYSGYHWKVDSVKAKQLGLKSYEQNHVNVVNNNTGFVKRILTSSKGTKYGNFEKLSLTKFDGTFIPLYNKDTGTPIVDNYRNMVPDPNKAGQHVATFDTPRYIAKDVKRKLVKDEAVQKYLDEHEDKIRTLESKDIPKMSKKIGGYDDE